MGMKEVIGNERVPNHVHIEVRVVTTRSCPWSHPCRLVIITAITARSERAALLQACLASFAADRPVMLLIDNQALVLRLQRGISTGRWDGDLPPFWQRISGLLIQGTVCIWIPSHNKVPDWTPPDGWIDVHLCRALNASADAQAGEVLRDSRTMIAAAVQRHQRAVAWAAAVWRLQRLQTLPFWQVVRDQQTFLAEC